VPILRQNPSSTSKAVARLPLRFGFITDVSEQVATQIAKNCRRRQPPRISAQTLYFQKLDSLAYILSLIVLWDGSIFIQICAVGSKRRIFSVTECVLAVQGHSVSLKVIDFGINRKRI